MRKWLQYIPKMVNIPSDAKYPLSYFKLLPPSRGSWPAELIPVPSIQTFYSLCDGGVIGCYHFLKLSELLKENVDWYENSFKGYYPNGQDAMDMHSALVLGHETAGGAPLIWRKVDEKMYTFFWKGGDWEPIDMDFDAFMEHLFQVHPEGSGDSSWDKVLEDILNL